jgi:hypothetical protein
MLNFSMVVWTRDKGGKRILGAEPIAFRLRTPLQDFRVATRGFPAGFWDRARERMQDELMETAGEQGGASGAWAALSDKPPGRGYASRKRKQYGEMPILQASGAMLASFFGGSDYVFEQSATAMRWGSKNPLAGYHQRGHLTPTPLPQRRLWDPGPELRTGIRSDAVRYCAERYREQGFRLAGAVPGETAWTPTRAEATAAGRAFFAGIV